MPWIHIEFRMPYSQVETLIKGLVFSGHVAILEWMLHHSLATGLEQDDFGATPVHDAAEQGQLECLGVFYNHSVNLEVRDNDGMIPLDLAKEKEHARCVQFLQNPERSFQEAKKDTKVRVTTGSYIGLRFMIVHL